MARKIKFTFVFIISSLLGLSLAGCSKLAIFNPAGIIASHEKNLVIIASLLMLVVVIPVLILSVWIPLWYRANNKKAKYDPTITHSVKMEIVWWGVPIVIILILATITWITTHALDPFKPLDSKVKPLTIQVVSMNWRWLFIYPNQKIATLNYVVIPANTPINFKLTSDGTMNSFFIPKLAGQIYTMTGGQTQLHLIANQIGQYTGRSTNFSGPGFADMTFIAQSVSPEDFNKWVQKVRTTSGTKRLSAKEYAEISKNTVNGMNDKVQYFIAVEDDLFNKIMNKYRYPSVKENNTSTNKTETK